jgi:hypothetical protein
VRPGCALLVVVFRVVVLVVVFNYLFQNVLRVVAHGHEGTLVAVVCRPTTLLDRVGSHSGVHRRQRDSVQRLVIVVPAIAFNGLGIRISVHGVSQRVEIGPQR